MVNWVNFDQAAQTRISRRNEEKTIDQSANKALGVEK
jgi:hypothetical protein